MTEPGLQADTHRFCGPHSGRIERRWLPAL